MPLFSPASCLYTGLCNHPFQPFLLSPCVGWLFHLSISFAALIGFAMMHRISLMEPITIPSIFVLHDTIQLLKFLDPGWDRELAEVRVLLRSNCRTLLINDVIQISGTGVAFMTIYWVIIEILRFFLDITASRFFIACVVVYSSMKQLNVVFSPATPRMWLICFSPLFSS